MLSLGILTASFALLWALNKRLKGRFLTPSGILLGAYCLCTLATVYLYCCEEVVLDPVAVTYYATALGALLLPIVRFDETQSVTIEANDTKIEVYISWFLAVFGLYSVAYNFPDMANALVGDLDENRMWTSSAANNANDIASVLATTGGYLFTLMIPLGFYWLATKRRSLLGTALLGGSCSYVVFVLKHVGRDAFIMWGAAFTFNFLLFQRKLSPMIRKWIMVGYGVALLILGVLFLIITTDRFPTTKTEGIIYPYASYGGQSPIHFSEHFLADRYFGHGRMNFNIVYRAGSAVGISEYDQDFLEDSVKETLMAENYFLNVFSSIVGSFFIDFGKYGTIVLVACVGIVMSLVLGRGGTRLALWQVMIYTMYMQVMTGGIFYYFYYPNVGNGALVFTAGTAIAIKYARNYKRKVQITDPFLRLRNARTRRAA
jgi:oligosaccharide repeat unit polymerase